MTFEYESWLKQAQDRLEDLNQQRTAIEEEIAALERGIEGFTPLVKRPVSSDGDTIGITEAVTRVFTDTPNKCFSPTQVRDVLAARGDVRLNQQNPLATIHQIIARLAARGVIKASTHDGRALYYHQPPRVGHFEAKVMAKQRQRLGPSAPTAPPPPPPTAALGKLIPEKSKETKA